MTHELPPLGYEYDALEPRIDATTMRIHHDKHHRAYVDNLNTALKKYPELQRLTAEDLLRTIDNVPEEIRSAVRNHGGGHVNHTLFWDILRPGGSTKPGGDLAAALEAIGGLEVALQQLKKAGTEQFGSGWAWITAGPDGRLQVESSPNQNSPLMRRRVPILGVDVWEHAYYLKYQNKRADYLNLVVEIINWDSVSRRYEAAVGNRPVSKGQRRPGG